MGIGDSIKSGEEPKIDYYLLKKNCVLWRCFIQVAGSFGGPPSIEECIITKSFTPSEHKKQ
jgi:hypothetical protein